MEYAKFLGGLPCGTCQDSGAYMKVSLAIATIGRKAPLERLLDSLCAQSHQDFEVLIADQNPTGFLDTSLAPYADKLHIHHLRILPRGVSAARNALLPHVTGDIVAFPDDDCWYVPDTLQQVVTFFTHNPEVGSIMGIWGHCPLAPELRSGNLQPTPLSLYQLFVRGETYVQFYRRSVVKVVGEFDAQLGPGTGLPYGGGEDTDYLLRAAKLGSVWKVPSVHLLHPLQDKQQVNKEKLRLYARGRMKLLQKHNMPLWFRLANVMYPLWKGMPEGNVTWTYRWHMFTGRLEGLVKR